MQPSRQLDVLVVAAVALQLRCVCFCTAERWLIHLTSTAAAAVGVAGA
jgi:hypothetical protein